MCPSSIPISAGYVKVQFCTVPFRRRVPMHCLWCPSPRASACGRPTASSRPPALSHVLCPDQRISSCASCVPRLPPLSLPPCPFGTAAVTETLRPWSKQGCGLSSAPGQIETTNHTGRHCQGSGEDCAPKYYYLDGITTGQSLFNCR